MFQSQQLKLAIRTESKESGVYSRFSAGKGSASSRSQDRPSSYHFTSYRRVQGLRKFRFASVVRKNKYVLRTKIISLAITIVTVIVDFCCVFVVLACEYPGMIGPPLWRRMCVSYI